MDRMNQFAQSLETSIRLANRLEETMLEETRAVETRDPDQLQRLVDEKQGLVTQLEAETQRQKRWVELEQYPFTPAGVLKFFSASGDGLDLSGRWTLLRDVIRRCDQLNRANGRLIERDRKRVALSLRLLTGEDETAATYDPHGRTRGAGPRSRMTSQA